MGRLIDADKLVVHLKDEIEGCKPLYCGRTHGKSIAYGTVLGLKSAIAFIEALATIEAEPVVHGRWFHDINNLYGCSECLGRETMSHKRLKPYCPNCGASMKGAET